MLAATNENMSIGGRKLLSSVISAMTTAAIQNKQPLTTRLAVSIKNAQDDIIMNCLHSIYSGFDSVETLF
tara:strand:+ start:267 stop:476 length:210 start_codon:yes stop_codon:yes gene_type:complete